MCLVFSNLYLAALDSGPPNGIPSSSKVSDCFDAEKAQPSSFEGRIVTFEM